MNQDDIKISPQDPLFSGLTFADFKFPDDVRWTIKGGLYEGWVTRINKKSITVETEECDQFGIYFPQFYIHPSRLFKGHIT